MCPLWMGNDFNDVPWGPPTSDSEFKFILVVVLLCNGDINPSYMLFIGMAGAREIIDI